MGKRLLTYNDLVNEYGVNKTFWKTQVWRKTLPNAGTPGKHLIDRKDVEAFLQKNKRCN